MLIPCVDCVPGDFAWIAGAVAGVGLDPGGVCAGAVLMGLFEVKWAWAGVVLGLSTQRVSWQDS